MSAAGTPFLFFVFLELAGAKDNVKAKNVLKNDDGTSFFSMFFGRLTNIWS